MTRRPRVEHPSQLRRPPKYAPVPDLSLATRGGKIATFAHEMRRPLLPHQQFIADVATEMLPAGSPFLFKRRLVIVSLPRQTGKTTLQRSVFVERCMTFARARTFMTAQLGKYASARWKDLVGDIEASPLLGSWVDVKRGKGDESATFPNGSQIMPFAAGPNALHSETPPLVGVDEAWAFTAEEGAELIRAIRPAQQTLWERQLWVISAAGDAKSEWWLELQDTGRASTLDPDSEIAYFEWAIQDDADPYDEDAWQFHPGLDGLVTIETLREEAKPENNKHADWLRGYMNRATKQSERMVLDLDAWEQQAQPLVPAGRPGAVAYGYDVAIDRSCASVWSAWTDPAGVVQLQVLDTREGDEWVAETVGRLHAAGAGAIGADDGGPARMVTDALTRARVPVTVLDGKTTSTAWAAFKADRGMRHSGSPTLRAALEVAVERKTGDTVRLSRRDSLGVIDAAIAAYVARWLAQRLTSPIQLWA